MVWLLNKVDVHIQEVLVAEIDKKRNHNSFDKDTLILFWEVMEMYASFCEARD